MFSIFLWQKKIWPVAKRQQQHQTGTASMMMFSYEKVANNKD